VKQGAALLVIYTREFRVQYWLFESKYNDLFMGNNVQASNSDLLKIKIQMVMPRLEEQLRLFWAHPKIDELFRQHLTQLYHSVRASVPLLECALEEARRLSPKCPVADQLKTYLTDHIAEEQGHDTRLLEDIEILELSDKVRRVTPPDIVTKIGTQYYYIKHEHPVSILAYLAVIEGNPPTTKELDIVTRKMAIPKSSLRSLYEHAEIDAFHSEELWSLIDSLPLTSSHTEILGVNAMMAVDQAASAYESLLVSSPE